MRRSHSFYFHCILDKQSFQSQIALYCYYYLLTYFLVLVHPSTIDLVHSLQYMLPIIAYVVKTKTGLDFFSRLRSAVAACVDSLPGVPWSYFRVLIL